MEELLNWALKGKKLKKDISVCGGGGCNEHTLEGTLNSVEWVNGIENSYYF